MGQTTSWCPPTFSPASKACQRDSHRLGRRVQPRRENAVAAVYTKNRAGVLAAAAICFCRNGRESNDGGNQCSVHSALSTTSLGNRGCVSTFRFAGLHHQQQNGMQLGPTVKPAGNADCQADRWKGLNGDVRLDAQLIIKPAPSSIRSDMTQGRRVRTSVNVRRA